MAIIPGPTTDSLVLATIQLDLVIIAVVCVIFDEAPALQVADMADMVLLSVAIDLLSVASMAQVAAMDPMAPLDVDLAIDLLPEDLLVDPVLAILDSHKERLALALAVSLPLIVLALIILVELATLKVDQLVA